MVTGKSINRVISLLLAIVFLSTNTAYSSETKLRVPLQLQTEAGQRRAQETMDAAKPGAQGKKLASNDALQRATKAVRTPVIGGNWKMEINSEKAALDLLREIAAGIENFADIEIVIAPSIVHLGSVSKALRELETNGELAKGTIKIAAQNIAGIDKGAHTGRTSILQIKNLEASYVIIGHSEQRRDEKEELVLAENRAINNKVKLTLGQNLIPIICVGESKSERDAGKTNEIVLDMLMQALDGLTPEQVANSIVAYEPVWAIGKGKTAATPQQAEDVLKFIRRLILDMFDEDTASKVRIIYGGSVKPDNIAGLMDKSVIPDNDGALVGGASLLPNSFVGIIKGVPVRLAHGAEGEKLASNEALKVREIQGVVFNPCVAETSGRPVYILDFDKAALVLDQLLASEEDIVLLIDFPDGGKVPDPFPVIYRLLKEKSRENSNVKGFIFIHGNMRNLYDIETVEGVLMPVIAVETSEELSVIKKADKITLTSDGRIRFMDTENIVASSGPLQDLISEGGIESDNKPTERGAEGEKLASNGTAFRDVANAIGDISKIRARILHNRYQPNSTTGLRLDIDTLQEIVLMAEDPAVSIAAESALESIADMSSLGVATEMARSVLESISQSRTLNTIGLAETAIGAKALKTGL